MKSQEIKHARKRGKNYNLELKGYPSRVVWRK
jgi:hypothetical protein